MTHASPAAGPRFAIGIDLGTTNSALAFAPLSGEESIGILSIPQWDTLSGLVDASTLPSFLYLPDEAAAARLRSQATGGGDWIVGRLARAKAGEAPGRVVHSAKSWLGHHAADRQAPILPWGSDDLSREQKISPVRAQALILNALRAAWNDRLAGSGAAFDDQDIAIAVPASFDAAAQRLTLAAAEEAGFPPGARLIEEPQAAFYCWLERHDAATELWAHEPGAHEPGAHELGAHELGAHELGAHELGAHEPGTERTDAERHVLVVDIGGGTSDFSLFSLRQDEHRPIPAIRRIAVSEHILLGGDNIDLALAHFVEPRFGGAHGDLSSAQWEHLVAACRDLKEKAFSQAGQEFTTPDEKLTVALPGRGSSLLAGARAATLTRGDVEHVVLDGFFPTCDAAARPHHLKQALREWGLPYASDSAITRHLADFLHGRPHVDAVLFNGGSLAPRRLRDRLRDQIAAWQGGAPPLALENPDPALAVARGAARFGALLRRPHEPGGHERPGWEHAGGEKIAAGAAQAVFLEVQGQAPEAPPALVCVLPQDASPDETFDITQPPLEVLVGRPVRFQAYSSSRHAGARAGDVLAWREGEFRKLPPLQTVIEAGHSGAGQNIPVHLAAKTNALGLLQVSCVAAEPPLRQSWTLEFNLRPGDRREHDRLDSRGGGGTGPQLAPNASPNASPDALDAARKAIVAAFAHATPPPNKHARDKRVPIGKPEDNAAAEKPNAARIFRILEQNLGSPRNSWNASLLRALWPALDDARAGKEISVEHEDAWLTLAGFLLRPGFGVAGDEPRIDSLWRAQGAGPRFPGKRIETAEYLLWRRVAAGLSRDRQTDLLAKRLEKLRGENAPGELVRLAGSLELLDPETKAELAGRFIEIATSLAGAKKHCAPYLAALGRLLNRAPLQAGPDAVPSPALVEQAFAAFRRLDWTDPELMELQTLFLRAARVIGDRTLDVPASTRDRIADKLEKSGVPATRTAKIRGFVPLERADRAGLLDEALPPGLAFGAE